jgi:hypothetical protein
VPVPLSDSARSRLRLPATGGSAVLVGLGWCTVLDGSPLARQCTPSTSLKTKETITADDFAAFVETCSQRSGADLLLRCACFVYDT